MTIEEELKYEPISKDYEKAIWLLNIVVSYLKIRGHKSKEINEFIINEMILK